MIHMDSVIMVMHERPELRAPILIEGLRRLEYRGYDSAGLAVIDAGRCLERVRLPGKVALLAEALAGAPLQARVGIAHTRRATHGVPNEKNAHPHVCRDSVAVVHNGIIENHDRLRRDIFGRAGRWFPPLRRVSANAAGYSGC